MQTQEFNKGHSFRVPMSTYGQLCRVLSRVPGVYFTKGRRFFWSGEDVGADFSFHGHPFQIHTDGWDGAMWVMTKDGHKREPEMLELRHAVEEFRRSGGPVAAFIRSFFPETFT